MNAPEAMAVDPTGNLYIPDSTNGLIGEVVSAVDSPLPLSPAPGSSAASPAGIAITQPEGEQVTFYPAGSGCFLLYVQVANRAGHDAAIKAYGACTPG